MTQSYNKLEVNIHISNGDVDLLYRDLDSGINCDETGDFSVQIEISLQLLDSEFDSPNVQFRDAEKDIWSC